MVVALEPELVPELVLELEPEPVLVLVPVWHKPVILEVLQLDK